MGDFRADFYSSLNLVGVVNRVYRVHLRRCKGRLSQLLMVGHRLHVLCYYRDNCRLRFGYWPYL